MVSILFITQIVLTILIVSVVLLQKSAGGGLIHYGGSNESVFGAKGPAGFLVKVTLALGALFLANTITLSYFYAQQNQKSVMDTFQSPIPSTTPTAPVIPNPPSKESK